MSATTSTLPRRPALPPLVRRPARPGAVATRPRTPARATAARSRTTSDVAPVGEGQAAAQGRRLATITAAWMTIVVAATMGLASVADVQLVEPPADADVRIDPA